MSPDSRSAGSDRLGGNMFDRETIIHTCATLFVVAAIIFGVTLSLRIWQKRERKRVAVVLEPIPLTEEQEADLYTALEALERVIATLEQDEAYQRETALGNDVVRLNESRPVREAREIIEREMAR